MVSSHDEVTKMTTKSSNTKRPAGQVVKDIRRATRLHVTAGDKIRIVLPGLRGEDSIAELCRKKRIPQSLYYTWFKEFMGAGNRSHPQSYWLRQSRGVRSRRGVRLGNVCQTGGQSSDQDISAELVRVRLPSCAAAWK